MKDPRKSEEGLHVRRWKIDLDKWKTEVQEIANEENSTTVASSEEPEKELSAEHSHSGDEVRLLLEGSAYFLVRVRGEG